MRIRAMAAAALVALAACGGGGGDSGDDDVATLADETSLGDTTSTTVDPEEAMLAFAECMRGNGVDFPDPGADGDVEIRVEEGDESAWQAAEEACADLRPAMDPMSEDEQAVVSDQLLAQFACMRDLGWDMPDPEITTSADRGVQFLFPRKLDIDMEDPAFQADNATCRQESGLDEGVFGGGGGGFGG